MGEMHSNIRRDQALTCLERRAYQRHGAVSHIRLHSQPVLLISVQKPVSPPA